MIPYHRQETNYTCAAACLRMVLASQGIKKTEQYLAKLLKTNTRRGTYHRAFAAAAKKFGLDFISQDNGTLGLLKKFLNQGHIIIVGYFPKDAGTDHYAVVKSITSKRVYFLDPYYGENHWLAIDEFKKAWKSDERWEKEHGWFFALWR